MLVGLDICQEMLIISHYLDHDTGEDNNEVTQELVKKSTHCFFGCVCVCTGQFID